ncbi:sodium-dependent transporter [Anaerotignum sp.]|nr:sodium-dependent transporter [Anaerotignum sp.]MBQ7758322.1 sodium-dependent transporter [Anaerotignum sp.]
MSTTENRGQFGSKLGFILSAAGSAVGLGNIWKFPGKAYFCGGGAFLIVYLIIVALIGTTVMMAEFTVGRKTHKNAVGAMRELNSKWSWVGGLGVLTGFIILCYYCQVGGWAIKYIVAYITDVQTVWADPTAYFLNNLLGADGTFPVQGAVIYPFIFLALTAYIISHGTAGIEKMSTILMPVLFIMLIGLMIRACTLPGADEGLAYMLHVDFSTINGVAILTALGQAFFSLSLGMGVMMTYASYLSNEDNLVSNTAIVCTLDTMVALFAGFMIIPAVFATGIAPGMGGGFGFATLAGVFMAIPGGQFVGMLFYFLLFFAAITSSTSILEGTIAFLVEEKGVARKKALVVTSVIIFIVGVLYTLSQAHMNLKGIWLSGSGVTFPIFGDFLEYLTDRLLLPAGAFFTTLFVGWVWGTENSIQEATSNGKFKFSLAPIYKVIVKFLDPIAIGAIIVAGMVFDMAIS